MNRCDVRYEDTWDLSKLFSSVNEFNNVYDKVKEEILDFSKYKDYDLTNSNNLLEIMNKSYEIERVLDKLSSYTSLLFDEDTTNSDSLSLKGRVSNLCDLYSNNSYFLVPNLLKIDYSIIKKMIDSNDKLKEYERVFENIFRYKKYTLSDKEEALLSKIGKMLGNNYETYEMIKDANIKFEDIIVNGEVKELTNSNYSVYIENKDREVRRCAFLSLYKTYKQFKESFSSVLYGNIKEEVVSARIRGYKSAQEESLYHDELDSSVYNNLVNTVNKNMNVVYKYYDLKKEILGLEELHLYDVYTPIIVDYDREYSFEEAKRIVLDTVKVLGEDYVNTLEQGYRDRWIDIYPNNGKRTGAYSGGCYDSYPYILLNYQNRFDDVSTLIHESGHSMHSYYSREANSYQYGYYSIFVAEVASTVNELLLSKYMYNHSTDKKEKLFILNRLMELFRATIYRQTMFAEFEKDIYDMVEEDEVLTSDVLCNKYYEINKKYFGSNVVIDDEIRYEWERIPHFYYNFYVYKYATGLSAACYIVDRILNGEENVREDYINFLKCGKSKSPLDSLKVAGVDLSSSKVIEKAIEMFDNTIDEFRDLYREVYGK